MRARSSRCCAAGSTWARSRSRWPRAIVLVGAGPGGRTRVSVGDLRASAPPCSSASARSTTAGSWGPRTLRRAQAARPRQHLPDHRRHLHAVRRRCCCPTGPARTLLWLVWGGRRRRRRVPGALGRRAALALRAGLHRARLGRGGLPAVFAARRRRRCSRSSSSAARSTPSAAWSTASAAPTPARAGSASTRCSTPSPWWPSSRTTSASRSLAVHAVHRRLQRRSRLGSLGAAPGSAAPGRRRGPPATSLHRRCAGRPARPSVCSPTSRTHQASACARERATPASTRVSSTCRSGWRSRVITGTARWVNSSRRVARRARPRPPCGRTGARPRGRCAMRRSRVSSRKRAIRPATASACSAAVAPSARLRRRRG